jgi:hypothetical protein
MRIGGQKAQERLSPNCPSSNFLGETLRRAYKGSEECDETVEFFKGGEGTESFAV